MNGLSHSVPDTQRVNDFVDACTHLLFRDVSVSRRLGLFNQTLDPIRFFRKETAGLQLIAVNRGINQAMTNIFTVIGAGRDQARSEEHTSELQSIMRTSYAVFCLQKNNKRHQITTIIIVTKF